MHDQSNQSVMYADDSIDNYRCHCYTMSAYGVLQRKIIKTKRVEHKGIGLRIDVYTFYEHIIVNIIVETNFGTKAKKCMKLIIRNIWILV